jgi:hypothetical protein
LDRASEGRSCTADSDTRGPDPDPLDHRAAEAVSGRPLPEWSIQHFYIVSAASLLAAAVAAILAVTTAQIGLYRVLLICLGFTSMGGIFAVHGLLTPGVIVPDHLEASAYRVVGMSAFFSLAVPTLFFAASFTQEWRGLRSGNRGLRPPASIGAPIRRPDATIRRRARLGGLLSDYSATPIAA